MIGHGRMRAVGLVAALGWSAPAVAQDFCATLKSLVPLAAAEFTSIQGEKLPGPGTARDVTVKLPGSTHCLMFPPGPFTIFGPPGAPPLQTTKHAAYRCFIAVPEVNPGFVKVLEQVSACFGDRYDLSPHDAAYGRAALEIVSDQGALRARQGTEIKDRPDYLVTIRVEKLEASIAVGVAKEKNMSYR